MQREPITIKAAGRELAGLRLRPDSSAAGPTLVFLHEGLGCIALWKDFPSRLCERLRLPGLVYDRWGYGASEPRDRPRPTSYLHDEAHVFLPAVLGTLGVDRCIPIGHSDGGSIALLFAAAFPTATTAIVTEAAHVFVEEITLAGIRAAGIAYAETDLRHRLARYHGDKTDSIFRAWHDGWHSTEFRNWDIEEMLPLITCPTLVLQGENDEYGTHSQVETIVRCVGGPVESVLLADCGHTPHQTAADQVLELIAGFITRL